ncbi:MAG: hypothetical protein J0J01_09020 [Reyranella sp.]|uniref:hypothetical protein n=1 Tax=Reyranella sp. TaxID=1929291 RepID=UPI001AD24EC7|nr:hypothetical protein [Reyranella sp.]MBN9087035.1 hypothetical protein [Reyranella sp.]
MWIKTADGSIVADDGKVIYFSPTRFISDIGLGHCCFICGRDRAAIEFNDEHVIPQWALRRYDLYDRKITLPNGIQLPYGRYKVPCCVDCNALLGTSVEEPISEAVARGPSESRKLIQSPSAAMMLFVWMALIFLKTHLYDRHLRFHLDKRKGSKRIADLYEWHALHHIHTLVRNIYVGAPVDSWNIGSLWALPAADAQEKFDYFDIYETQTVLLRFDGVGFVAALNDCGKAGAYYTGHLSRITGPLSPIQLREVFAELSYLNDRLHPRPSFMSDIDAAKERLILRAEPPSDPQLIGLDPAIRGKYLRFALQPWRGKLFMSGASDPISDDAMDDKGFSTLFHEGEYIADPRLPNIPKQKSV